MPCNDKDDNYLSVDEGGDSQFEGNYCYIISAIEYLLTLIYHINILYKVVQGL